MSDKTHGWLSKINHLYNHQKHTRGAGSKNQSLKHQLLKIEGINYTSQKHQKYAKPI
jgi:hypothetical protein